MRKSYLIVGGIALLVGCFMFASWILGFDLQYNRLGFDEIIKKTYYYLTCEKWSFSPYGSVPCLNGHSAGWDLIPSAITLGGLALIIYGILRAPVTNVKLIR